MRRSGFEAAQHFQIDIVGNTDNVPIGSELIARYPSNSPAGRAQNRRTDLLLRPDTPPQ